MSDPRESVWGPELPFMAALLEPSADGFPRVRFQGAEYIMVGEAITTPELYEAGECSFAHLCGDGLIRRFREVIGRKEDLIPLPEAT